MLATHQTNARSFAVDKQRWQRIQGIFKHLSDKSPGHRQDYLDMVCEFDAELRHEIEALLASHDRLEQGARDPVTPVLQAAQALNQPQMVGDYSIQRELGRGGMGVVYLASHPQHGRVALKLLPRYTVTSDEALQRFTQEGRVLRKLSHPALCRLYEFFTSDDYAVLAMEFIDGQGLDERLREGPLPLAQGLTLIQQICDVLIEAHAQGLAHRDLKPSNVLLDASTHARLIDFGIAKFADTRLTATGQVLGTPGYMSPEQWQGHRVDARTDLWSLGILLFEVLSGHKPFAGDSHMALAQGIMTGSPATLPPQSCDGHDLSAAQALVDRLLLKDPQARLSSCTILRDQIGLLTG